MQKHDDEPIYFQSKAWPEHRFLSNFHLAPVVHNGIVYPSNEHFYQAHKASSFVEREKIANAETPKEAKRLGSLVKLENPDAWLAIRDEVMLKGLRLKFSQHDDLAKKLLDTGNVQLIEWAPWGDTYWGVDKNYVGQNKLGFLLMKVRDELKNV